MKRLTIYLTAFAFVLLMVPRISLGSPVTYQSHLWLGDQFTNFSDYENSPGYVGDSDNAWFQDSIVDSDPFNLFIYNASTQINAVNVHLIATVHSGESGVLSVGGTTYNSFTGSGLPTGHNGSHGVWSPSGDGMWIDIPLLQNIGTGSSLNVGEVFFTDFSMIHFDTYSEPQLVGNLASANNLRFVGLRNPYSHDKTSVPGKEVPEPSTLLLLGTGLMGIAITGRKKVRK